VDAVLGFSVDQIKKFADACRGITPDQANIFSSDQLNAFRADCIGEWSVDTINNMTSIQLQTLTGEQCSGFGDKVQNFTNQTLENFLLEQIGNFSSLSITSLSGLSLYILYSVHGQPLVTLYGASLCAYFSASTINDFKAYFKHEPPLIHGDIDSNSPLLSPLQNIQWLILTFIMDTAIPDVLTSQTIQNVPPEAIRGLRKTHMEYLQLPVFAQITSEQAQSFVSDIITDMPPPSFGALAPSTFAAINFNYIPLIPISTIPYLTLDQLNALSCNTTTKFTKTQRDAMTATQTDAINEICNPPTYNWHILVLVLSTLCVVFIVIFVSSTGVVRCCKAKKDYNAIN